MRRVQKIMDGWIFIGQNGKEEEVKLPHSWNAIDGQDGGNDYYRGTCIYKKNLKRPEYGRNERVYLQFHGVNSSAIVFFNDVEVCSHDNGYSTFRVDITEHLEEINDLVVKVDNSINRTVYPQKADFTFYGGIYRDVELLVVSENHFELDYYGGYGLQYTTEMDKEDNILKIKSYVKTTVPKGEYEIIYSLFDENSNLVAQCQEPENEMHIKKIHLWDGIKNPYLYTLKAELFINEKIEDEVSCKVGFRKFEVDPQRGFFLNGREYPLRGVSKHQDYKAIGNAISYEQMRQDMDLIREVGANTIRLAHYQHDQYFYDLCDKYGMIVWAEIPYISAHMPEGRENTLFQMKELIVQNYNHPCIIAWGLSNEITISPMYKKDMLDNHRELQKLVKELDTSRVTTLACYAMCRPFHPVTKISDIIAWNLYLGWYVPGLFLNDCFMRFYHFLYPKRCLGYSEYGAEGMPNLHSSRPRRGDHTEEYQAKYHEYMLRCFERHPFLWGTYVWNMFDFAADARDQGGEPGINHKGLVTFDRQIKKDSFYLYKAWWNKEEPFVYLSGKRYKYRTEARTNVTVYTNQDEVELYNNGELLEVQKGRYVFHFHVEMKGKNHLVVKSNGLIDEVTIFRTDRALPEYKVKKGKSQNWV